MAWALGAVKNPKGCVTVGAARTTWHLPFSKKISQLARVNQVIRFQTMLKIVAHARIPNLRLVPRAYIIGCL